MVFLVFHKNEAKTNEGLTLPEINTDKQNSGHAPYFHFLCERPIPQMIAAGKGRRGKTRSEYLFGNRVMARY